MVAVSGGGCVESAGGETGHARAAQVGSPAVLSPRGLIGGTFATRWGANAICRTSVTPN